MKVENKRSLESIYVSSGGSIFQVFFGLIILVFFSYALFESESTKSESNIYEDAKPINASEEGDIVYMRGRISASPIQSKFVKSGNYISIKHESEVYAWGDNVISSGSSSKNGGSRPREVTCELEWRSEIIPPDESEKCRNKPLYERTIKDESVYPKDAKIEADGKSYLFESHKLTHSSNIQSEIPSLKNTILNGFFAMDDYLYINQECTKKMLEGCERVILSVTPTPTVETLLIGKLNGNKLTSFDKDDQKIIYMDTDTFENALKKFDLENLNRKKGFRFYGFLGILLGVFLTRKGLLSIFRYIPFFQNANSITLFFFWCALSVAVTGFIILISKLPIPVLILFIGIGYLIYKKYFPRFEKKISLNE